MLGRSQASIALGRGVRAWFALPALLAAASLSAASAAAQQPAEDGADAGGAGTSAGRGEVAASSPRASLQAYLELTRRNAYGEAAAYLDVPGSAAERAPELARRLKSVLDEHVWFDLGAISPLPGGDPKDGLPQGVDEVARIPGAHGGSDAVQLARSADGQRWLFARGTVARIDGWYARLEHRWLREHLPAALLAPGPKELLVWQWIALPLILLLAWLGGLLLSRLSRRLLVRVTRGTSAAWDDQLASRMGGPLTLAWTLALCYFAVPWLGLYEPAEHFVHGALRGALFVAFFWALSRVVDIGAQILIDSPWGRSNAGSRSLVTVGARVGKLVVLAIGVVALLSQLGYPVASLVAGLGIGGLAMALAAQKTVENLFGAFSIAADQPFREGDFVKVEDFVGTVEAIGLRSTRIRTLDRTLISLPNGRLADMRLESFAARDRIRLSCVIGVVYGTTAAQMRQILEGFERALREHPKIWQEAVVVRFREFAASSLDIEIMAWFETQDFGEFQGYRQEVLLRFMEVVEQAGSSFAFPTRTVHLAGEHRRSVDAPLPE